MVSALVGLIRRQTLLLPLLVRWLLLLQLLLLVLLCGLLLLLLGLILQSLHACCHLLQERGRVQQPQQCGLRASQGCIHAPRHQQLIAKRKLLQVGTLQQLLHVCRAKVCQLYVACAQHSSMVCS